MYLVEIETGREKLYDSVEALGAAIRRGEVGAQSRIYHRTSSSWISITLHPEFKKAIAIRESEPLPPLARTKWTFFGAELKSREIDEAPATGAKVKQPAAKPEESHRGFRGLLARAFRSRAPIPRPSGS
jgi:hypothetical protein